MIIPHEALLAAQAHARKDYPRESCGLLVDGAYVACHNYASEPERDFIIATPVWVALHAQGKEIQAVIHSHPGGPIYPSARDMQGQLDTNVPWAIVPVFSDGRVADPTVWGDEIKPVIGRQFCHGVSDCYSIIEDCFALGRAALAAQGVDWPFDPIPLKAFPRNDGWWGGHDGANLYERGYKEAGFYPIAREDVAPGDVFLCKIKSDQINHGGVLIGNGMVLHHLPLRLSRKEPAGIWARAAEKWVRYAA